MRDDVGYETIFARLVQIVQNNTERLSNIYEHADDAVMVRENAELMYIDNLTVEDMGEALWRVILKMLMQRDQSQDAAFRQLVRNIEDHFGMTDEDHGKGRVILDLITGQLDDPVWEDYRNQAMHYLRAAADDVMARREDQPANEDYYFEEGA